MDKHKHFISKIYKKYVKRILALSLVVLTLMTSVPSVAFAKPVEANRSVTVTTPHFTESAIAAMQEVCGETYNARDVLGALYLLGAVDEYGMPSLSDSYVVNGVNMNTAQLREAANSHLYDKVDESVTVDGVDLTWSEVRSLFAVAEMQAHLNEAKAQGIAMNDDAHIFTANKLLNWLKNLDPNLGDEWHPVTHVGHIGGMLFGENQLKATYWKPKSNGTQYVESELVRNEDRNSKFSQTLIYIDPTGETVPVNVYADEAFASRYTSEYADRLWFPAPQKKFSNYEYGECELVLDKNGTKYNGEYDYFTEISTYLKLKAIISNSGYNAEKVRIVLHADSAEDVARANGGFVKFEWTDDYSYPSEAACDTIILDAAAYAAMVSEAGLEIGIFDMKEYSEQNDLVMTFRASSLDKSNTDYSDEETLGCFRSAGMYLTFEVIGEKTAPTASPYNTRLWMNPVDGMTDTYVLNPNYYELDFEIYGLGKKAESKYVIHGISEQIAANGYIDLYDNTVFLDYVLSNKPEDADFWPTMSSTLPNQGTYFRLFLTPVSPLGTKYTVNMDLTNEKMIRRYGFRSDLVYDIPDEVLAHALTYSFIDYPNNIHEFPDNAEIKLGGLKVNADGASMAAYTNLYTSYDPIPVLFWDSASETVNNISGYRAQPGTPGSLSISYNSNGRAVLVQSRALTYLKPYTILKVGESGESFNHLTETRRAFTQYGIYDKNSGTTFEKYDFTYNDSNPAAAENLHITAPAMTYYTGDVIPFIVRNPNGIFGNPSGSTSTERTEWAKKFRLTMNGRSLEPAQVTFRQDVSGAYGVDMLVFLYEVGDFEADSFDFANMRISYDGGTAYRMVNDIPDNKLFMKTFEWNTILDTENAKVVSVGAKNYFEIPIHKFTAEEDPNGELKEAMYQMLINWVNQEDRLVKNVFAVLSTDGDPREAAERVPFYAYLSSSTMGEEYESIRVELPTEDAYGSPLVTVRIYTGTPMTGGNYVSYDSDELTNNNWNCDGFSVEGGRFHVMDTFFVRLPKITYYKGEGQFSLLYNDGWDDWASAMQYRSYKKAGKPEIVLSYAMPATDEDGNPYSYSSAENFSWKSDDESIALVKTRVVDDVVQAVVVPTGVTGNVTFTLTCGNGGGEHTFTIQSLTMTVVEDSLEAYLSIPETLTPIIVRKDSAASVTFASNIQQMNEAEGQATTDFTLKVYEAELSGGKLVKVGSPVYTKTETASKDTPVYVIRIPENKLSNVSPNGSESYIAEITSVFTGSDDKLPEGQEDGNFVAEVPVKVRNYPVQIDLTSNDNPYMLGGATYTADWTVKNANAAYDWRYYITDENGNVIPEYENSGNGTFDRTSITFTAPEVEGVLKRAYTLNIAASNDVEGEGYTMAVKTLYVYNRDALDILVEASERVKVEDDTVTMDNREWLKKYLSSDGKTINLGNDGISFGSLQTDTHLDSLISLNYGDYAWGLISDAIEWKVAETESDPIDFYYKKMGVFSDTAASGLENYLPTTDFSLIAVRDGQTTVTAKHALSGIKSSVTVNVDVLDHELILFQFYPAEVTTVTYTLKTGESVTVTSDANGQLALYEAEGIDDDTRFYLKSTVNDTEYVGMTTMSTLKSGEKNAVNGKTYPVNLIKLQKPAEIHLYFNDEDGKPIANEAFTVRGGVYYDNTYAEHADLFDETNRTQSNIAGDVSSGLNDLTYTSDKNGMLKVFFNLSQFTASGELDPAKDLLYVFEIRKEGYLPEMVYVRPYEDSNAVINLTPVEADKAEKPFLWEFNVKCYSGADAFIGYLPVEDSTVNVGPSKENKRVGIEAQCLLWGHDELIDRTSGVTQIVTNPGKLYFADDGLLTYVGDGNSENAQEYEFWTYPFSSFVFCKTTLDANQLSLSWLEERKPVPMDLQMVDGNGDAVVTVPLKYSLYRNIAADEPAKSNGLDSKAAGQQDSLSDKKLKFDLDKLVPGGDILATGITFLTNSLSGQNFGVYFKVSPTADPTVFYVMMTVSDEEPEDDEEEDKNYKIEPSYEDIQNLGAEIISKSGVLGSTHHYQNFEKNKKGLFGSLQKEAEEMKKIPLNKEEREKQKKAEEDKKDDDDDDDDDHFGFAIGGSLIGRATYNPKKDDWDLDFSGGSISLKGKAQYEYHKNIIVGYVPFTFSFGAEASLGITIGAHDVVLPKLNKQDTFSRMDAELKGKIEGFGGLGLDVGLIAAKIGVFGEFEADAIASVLISDSKVYTGAKINLKGGIGLKVVFKALVVNFEYEIASIQFGGKDGKDFFAGDFKTIEDLWAGKDVAGHKYRATTTSDGRTLFAIEKSNGSIQLFQPSTKLGESILHTYAKDVVLENIIYSDDGKKIFFLEDGVAFIADSNGVAEKAISSDEVDDYGQFYLDAAGKNGNYAAAWVTQTCESNFDDRYEPTYADLAAAMNSTEITAAICKNGEWTTTRLTDNNSPDLVPSVATSEDGRYVLVSWRSVYMSDPDAPFNFDVEDYIMYRIYDTQTDTWSEAGTAFNGIANGSVNGLDSVVFNNGNAVIAFNVQTGSDEEEAQNGLETFYAFIENTQNGTKNTTVRLTDNKGMDNNVQLLKITDSEEEYAVLGWYSENGEESDINLRLFDANGNIDDTYPSSIAKMSDERISEKFHLSGVSKENLMIGWINMKMEDGAAAASGDLVAARLYLAGADDYRVAPAQIVASSLKDITIDDFTLTFDGEKVTAILSETDYSSGDKEIAATLTVDDVVNRAVYTDQAAYEYDRNLFMEQYPEGTMDLYVPVGYFKTEMKQAEFKNEISVTKIRWNQDTVAPMLNVPVQFTIQNDGCTPLNQLCINDVVYDGFVLNPGENTKITVDYQMTKQADDKDYTISVPNDDTFDEITNTIHFCTPEVKILETKEIKAAEGKRTMLVRLGNANMVPANEEARKYHITAYADMACTIPVSDIVLTSDQIKLLDENAAVATFEVDAQEVMEAVGKKDEEIPESGVALYVVADTCLNDGEVLDSTLDTVFMSTLCTNVSEKIALETPEFVVNGDNIEGSYTIMNTSINDLGSKNFAIALHDADGKILAIQIIPDVDMTSERIVTDTFSIAVANTDDIQTVSLEILDNAEFPALTETGFEFGGWYEDPAFTAEAQDDTEVAYAKWDSIDAVIEGITLVLGGNIGMVFHTSLNENAENGRMVFTVQGKDVATVEASECKKDEQGRYMFQCDLTSVQMSEPVTATYHWGENRSVKVLYSIEDYAAQLLEDSQYSAEAKAAVKALINYGHYAQIILSEVNNWELGVDYAETETCFGTLTATAADLEPYRFVQSGNDPLISKVQFTLGLNSQTSIRLLLTTPEKPSVTVDGEAAEVYSSGDDEYYIVIKDIGAGMLGHTYTVVANEKETYEFSALSYATVVLNGSASEDLQNVVKALYEYYMASVAYNATLN